MGNTDDLRQSIFDSGFSFDDIINLNSYIRKETAIFWADEDHFRMALPHNPQLRWDEQHLIVVPLLQLDEEHSAVVERSLLMMGELFLDVSCDCVTPIALFGTALTFFAQLEPTCSENVENPDDWIENLTRLSSTFLSLSQRKAQDKPLTKHERIRFHQDWTFFAKHQSDLWH